MERVSFEPKLAGKANGLKACFCPPVGFLARAVQFAVMCPAKRYREFVADLEAEAAALRETEVMRIAGLASADEAGLRRDEP